MALRLKEDLDPEILRKYGFHLGEEDFGKETWCGNGAGHQYQAKWYHKFLTWDEDTGEVGENLGPIAYSGDRYKIPMVHIFFRIGSDNDLYIDCSPSNTYHIGGEELDIIADTIYELVKDGVVEKY